MQSSHHTQLVGTPSRVDSLRWPGLISPPAALKTAGRSIHFHSDDHKRSYFPVRLYRFMASTIPLIGSVIWTWSRLAAAPGEFVFVTDDGKETSDHAADLIIQQLFHRIFKTMFARPGGPGEILPPFFQSLFLDGAVCCRLKLHRDLSGIDTVHFFDLAQTELSLDTRGGIRAIVHNSRKEKTWYGEDIFFTALSADLADPFGHSILSTVPFISYIEQQLVDDMRRAMHNSGYHRLHVKITPPEKREGETDQTYVDRANAYFDSTVAMIRNIKTEDNPVTWNDVAIEYIGPGHQGSVRSNNWYLSHRAMIEEICSGTNLAPFLLGYSYNATTNWAQFKYDLVMRQVRSVQAAAISFLERLANVELALRGFSVKARWRFDNAVSALAGDVADVKNRNAERIVKLFESGLISQEMAEKAAGGLL